MMQEIKTRRSIRKYKDRQVSDTDLMKILEAGRLAPSGSNTQPWHFIIIKNEEIKKAISEIDHKQEWMLKAPIFIACVADIRCRIESPEKICCDEKCDSFELKQIIRDSAIAIGYMLLEAEHIGLGTCWTGWYAQEDMKRVLGLPDYMYVNGIITLGYADEFPNSRPRKSLEEIVSYKV